LYIVVQPAHNVPCTNLDREGITHLDYSILCTFVLCYGRSLVSNYQSTTHGLCCDQYNHTSTNKDLTTSILTPLFTINICHQAPYFSYIYLFLYVVPPKPPSHSHFFSPHHLCPWGECLVQFSPGPCSFSTPLPHRRTAPRPRNPPLLPPLDCGASSTKTTASMAAPPPRAPKSPPRDNYPALCHKSASTSPS